MKYQQRGPRQYAGSCAHKRRAVARLRSPSTQATMRRLSRSTASQSQTLRFLRPTNVHISSNSNAGQRLRRPFFGRNCGSGGEAAAAFF